MPDDILDLATQAGVDLDTTPLDTLMSFENLGHAVADMMEHGDD